MSTPKSFFSSTLGLKSYCLRHFKDPQVAARMTRDIGVTHIDLSACHVDYTDPSAQQRTLAACKEFGLTVSGAGVVTLSGDETTDRRYFQFCKLAGCAHLAFTTPPDNHMATLQLAAKLADEYGMKASIHNHGGKHWLGNSTILTYLFNHTPPSIGLCLDTAWCIDAGEDPVDWVTKFASRLYCTHLKDFTFDRVGKHTDVVVGTGSLNLPAYLSALQSINFSGPFVIEYEANPENPQAALTDCAREIQAAIAQMP